MLARSAIRAAPGSQRRGRVFRRQPLLLPPAQSLVPYQFIPLARSPRSKRTSRKSVYSLTSAAAGRVRGYHDDKRFGQWWRTSSHYRCRLSHIEMNDTQRDALAQCLSQIFGDVSSPLVDELAPKLDWVEVNGGQTLMREGDSSDAVYFVVSGRLRAYAGSDRQRPLGDIPRGETVGEIDVLSGAPRSATVIAVRDSVLARASPEVFEEIWKRHPDFSMHLTRGLVARMKRAHRRPEPPARAVVCLLPVTDGIDLHSFGPGVAEALGRWGTGSLATREVANGLFGPGAADARPADERYHRISAWLEELELSNDYVVLLADDGETEWTRRCIRHADEVLLLARADAAPRVHPVEERLCSGARCITGARQTLVLLHPRDRKCASGTDRWLQRRRVDSHLHLRPELPRDMSRLARILSGNAVGLVLGGGGARGFAHLGAYKALEEFGIEIDYVGGTSIGGVMAAYVSFDLPAADLIDHARRAFARNPTGDFNFLPLLSLVKGQRLRTTIARAVINAVGREADVADSWRNLFCVASSYSRAREVVLEQGPLDRALSATVSIPVALPPVPWRGELLVDGAVFNNFPTDVMSVKGARRIIGVDLSRQRGGHYDLDHIPGTGALLRDRLRSRKERRYKLPGLGAMLMGTTLLYSESRRQQACESVDIYVNPDLAAFPLLDWKSLDRIIEIGYRETREVLSGMSEAELAPYRNAARLAHCDQRGEDAAITEGVGV